jgi:hypothetical protein
VNVERRAKKQAVKCVMIADSSFHMQSAPLFPCADDGGGRGAGRLLRILINSAGGAGSLTSISGIPSEQHIM